MSDIVIKVENLSKLYHLGELHKRTNSFRDKVTNMFRRKRGNEKDQTIWALKDVSFEVKKGEVIGIIGCNGAGKSTLLKVLSRITKPTEGKAWVDGRVGSLLEVGTGFHPELTGRENTYLNGAILGMKRNEIGRKFDEIVAFAEIEKFIDTPVKRYSSGMSMRLAFAIAAHLEPDILLVDEVLAVGDVNFQKKCLNRMQEMENEVHTIIFVSHNLAAITSLCNRTILLDDGRVLKDGPSHQVVKAYLHTGTETSAVCEYSDITKAPGNDIVRLRAIRVRTENGQTTDIIDISEPFGIEMKYEVLKAGNVLVPNCHFYNEDGVRLFTSLDTDMRWRYKPRIKGKYVSTIWIPGNLLSEGALTVSMGICTLVPETPHFFEHNVVAFRVIDSLEENPTRGGFVGPMPGIVRPLLKWNTQFNPG